MQLNNTYDCHGIIESIPTDNGTEFKNGSVISALSPFGTRIEWCDAEAPEQKSYEERIFGTINWGFCHNLPGTTKSSVKARNLRDAEKEATLSIDDLRQLFEKYIVDVYHQDFHEGLEDTPATVWAKGVAECPVRLPASVNDFIPLLPGTEKRVIQRKGIRFKKNFYNSPDLSRVRDGESGKQVRIKYDETDLSKVFVENPDTRQYFEVPSVNFAKTSSLSVEKQDEHMGKVNARRNEVVKDQTNIRSRGELNDAVEEKRFPAGTSPKPKKVNDPHGKQSPEVEISEQTAAIPASEEGFDDLEAGSDVLPEDSVSQAGRNNQAAASKLNAANSNDDLKQWRNENRRAQSERK